MTSKGIELAYINLERNIKSYTESALASESLDKTELDTWRKDVVSGFVCPFYTDYDKDPKMADYFPKVMNLIHNSTLSLITKLENEEEI